MKSIGVLIVDDSAVVRRVLSAELDREPDIKVLGVAPDPFVARDLLLSLQPDVVLLDIEMPRMDGLTFLKKLMHYHPTPVVILSSLTTQGSATAMEALDAGAVEVVCKPGGSFNPGDLGRWLGDKVRSAAEAGRRGHSPKASPTKGVIPMSTSSTSIIAIGASTGGTEAVGTVISQFPANCPGTLIAQHMPPGYTHAWAERLNAECAPSVREARDGDRVEPGSVLVAPGDRHMVLHVDGKGFQVRLNDGPKVHHQRPSCDVLLESVARHAGRHAVGAIMTGMGADGAEGLLAMRRAGARTLVQDEETSIVFGMPKKALELDAAERVFPLHAIANCLLAACRDRDQKAKAPANAL